MQETPAAASCIVPLCSPTTVIGDKGGGFQGALYLEGHEASLWECGQVTLGEIPFMTLTGSTPNFRPHQAGNMSQIGLFVQFFPSSNKELH